MSFTQTQVRKLRSRLKPQHIRTREAEGVSLSYLEGWHVLAEAKRIFSEMVRAPTPWRLSRPATPSLRRTTSRQTCERSWRSCSKVSSWLIDFIARSGSTSRTPS